MFRYVDVSWGLSKRGMAKLGEAVEAGSGKLLSA